MKKYLWLLIITFILISGSVFIFFSEPTQTRIVPPCFFHKLTNLHCPGCGSFRGLHSLLSGDIPAAFRFNPLLMSLLPFLGVIYVKYAYSIIKKEPFCLSTIRPVLIWILVGAIFSFWIFRNTPWYPEILL